jgi:CubicO group peptidase (beta-lactamase class C family)
VPPGSAVGGVGQRGRGSGTIQTHSRIPPHLPRRAPPPPQRPQVQHLLNHQGGWLTNSSTSNPEFRLNAIAQQLDLCNTCSLSKAQLARFSFGLPLQFTPGTQNLATTNFLSYSNMGYILLGLLVEKVQPLSFTDYVRTAILAPIGVTDVYRARTAQNLRAANEGYYQSTGAGYTSLRRLDVSQALGEQQPFAYGGRNYATETMDSGGGLMSTATALSQFAQTYASWGTGGPSGSRIGSMAGTVSRMAYLGGTQKLSVAYILNGGVAGANTAFDASFEAMIASRTW